MESVQPDRSSYEGLIRIPITELTDNELHSLRIILNGRIKDIVTVPLPDLTDEALIESEKKEDKKYTRQELETFIDSQGCLARMVKDFCKDMDRVGPDEVIGFIASGGLERSSVAAIIATREYSDFLRWMGEVKEENVIKKMIEFYEVLGRALNASGVNM